MISLLQIIGFVFVLFTASRVILRARDKKLKFRETIFWLSVWFVLIFVIFFPELTSNLAKILGIGRGIDVIIYSSIGLLFYLIFRLYVKLEEAEQEITKVVREVALSEKRKKK